MNLLDAAFPNGLPELPSAPALEGGAGSTPPCLSCGALLAEPDRLLCLPCHRRKRDRPRSLALQRRPLRAAVAGLVCYSCRGSDFWHGAAGVLVCRRCHPPAPVAERLAREDANPTPGPAALVEIERGGPR